MKEETIRKCFRKAGITDTTFSVLGRQYEDEDPFADLEAQEELHDLVDQIPLTETCCQVEEYINGEDEVPVCMEYDNDWEDRFFADLNADSDSFAPEDAHEEEEEFDLEPPPQKITKYQDAIAALEAVQIFIDSKGYSEEATRITSTMNRLTHLHCTSLIFARQSTIQEFFHPV